MDRGTCATWSLAAQRPLEAEDRAAPRPGWDGLVFLRTGACVTHHRGASSNGAAALR